MRLTARMSKTAQFWLVKQEPTAYSWVDFVKEGRAVWTGVRNFQARLNLRAMRTGDAVLFYHSVVGKEIVGIAKVAAEAYPDATATEGDWSCVDLTPVRVLKRPVTLDEIKASATLRDIKLVKQSRLSVMALAPAEYAEILLLSQRTTPDA